MRQWELQEIIKKTGEKSFTCLSVDLQLFKNNWESTISFSFFTATEIVGHTQFTYMYELNVSRLVPNMHFFF